MKEEQVFKYPFGMHRWWPPCTDTPLAMWWSAKTAYPELFTDVDMDAVHFEKVVDQTTEATWTMPEEEKGAEPEVHTEEEHREE